MAQNAQYSEKRIIGVDAYNDETDIGEGFLLRADNLVVEGAKADGSGGTLVTRSGKRGLFTAALGAPLYALKQVIQSDGSVVLVFVSGGKLYKCAPNATAPTEIKLVGGASLTLNGITTWFEAAAGRVYFCDGVSGSPLRYTDLTTAFVVGSVNRPTAAPSPTLTNLPLFARPGDIIGSIAQSYSSITGTGEQVNVGDRNFQNTHSALFTFGSGADPGNTLDANGDPCVELDNKGEYALSVPISVPHTTDGLPSPVVIQTFEFAAEDTGSNDLTQVVDNTLKAFSDAGGTDPGSLIATFLNRSSKAGEFPAQTNSFLYDLRGLASDPLTLRMRFEQPFDMPGTTGTDVNRVSLFIPQSKFNLVGLPDGSLMFQQGTVAAFQDTLYCGGLWFQINLGGAKDYTRKNRIRVAFTVSPGISGLTLRPYLRQTATGTKAYCNALDADGFVDISTLSDADRTGVNYLGFDIVSDLALVGVPDTVSGSPASSVPIFTISSITEPGNLPIGYANVSYILVECDVSGDPTGLVNIIQSDGSPVSAALTPTTQAAVGKVVLQSPPTNGAATFFKLFRFGGPIGYDGKARLVAFMDYGATTFDFGPNPSPGTYMTNPYVKWSKAGTGSYVYTLYDNTPDAYLANAEEYQAGRQSAPTGASAGLQHANRLWLAVSSTLYGSWLLDADENNGLYYTTDILDVVNDASAVLKGFTVPVGGNIKDPIVALVEYRDRMVATKASSRPSVLIGIDPRNFELHEYTGQSSVSMGHLARRAITVWKGAIYYLGPDGLVRFDLTTSGEGSVYTRKYLNPSLTSSTALPLTPFAYAQSYLFVHGHDLYLGVAQASTDTAPAVLLRFDGNQDSTAPTRLLQMAMSLGCDVNGTSQQSGLFLAGQDGQLYALDSVVGDKALPSSEGSPVAWSMETRRWGGDAERHVKNVIEISVDIFAPAEATTLTLEAIGDRGNPGAHWTTAFNFGAAGGDLSRLDRPASSVKGRYVSAKVSGLSLGRLKIRHVGLRTTLGARKAP